MACNLILIGAKGRLGSAILSKAQKDPAIDWIAEVEREQNSISGSSVEDHVRKASVILDAASPQATLHYLVLTETLGCPLPYVVGCTGWSESELGKLLNHSKDRPILFAPNFSLGVAILDESIRIVTSKLKNLEFKVSMEETHHVHKKDAPSGTARLLAETIQKITGEPVPIQSVREGETIGRHRVDFSSAGETLSFIHEAHSREIFAAGAVTAAKWLAAQRKPGFYSMRDVLFSN